MSYMTVPTRRESLPAAERVAKEEGAEGSPSVLSALFLDAAISKVLSSVAGGGEIPWPEITTICSVFEQLQLFCKMVVAAPPGNIVTSPIPFSRSWQARGPPSRSGTVQKPGLPIRRS